MSFYTLYFAFMKRFPSVNVFFNINVHALLAILWIKCDEIFHHSLRKWKCKFFETSLLDMYCLCKFNILLNIYIYLCFVMSFALATTVCGPNTLIILVVDVLKFPVDFYIAQ